MLAGVRRVAKSKQRGADMFILKNTADGYYNCVCINVYQK